jgi:hypothetical protein
MKWYNNKIMATGATANYDLPYPLFSDPVNIHGDFQDLAEQIELILPSLVNHTIEVRNVSGASIAKATPVYITGFSTKPTIGKCDSDDLTTFPVLGLTDSAIGNNTDGVVTISGVILNANTNSFTAGNVLYVANNGGLTATQPATGSGAVAIVGKANATTGILVVGQPKGNGSWGSLKAGLS